MSPKFTLFRVHKITFLPQIYPIFYPKNTPFLPKINPIPQNAKTTSHNIFLNNP